MQQPAGWYPDPQQPGLQRWWDGSQWTLSTRGSESSRTWAIMAHLSALVAAFFALAFIGPLVVYLIKKDDDPYVRQHAVEALNFHLTWLLFGIVFGIITVILFILIIGILLIPVWIAAGIAWLVLVIMGGVKAGRGEPWQYPLTIRFIQ